MLTEWELSLAAGITFDTYMYRLANYLPFLEYLSLYVTASNSGSIKP